MLWELTSWEVDLVEVDLVGVDVVEGHRKFVPYCQRERED